MHTRTMYMSELIWLSVCYGTTCRYFYCHCEGQLEINNISGRAIHDYEHFVAKTYLYFIV